MAFGVDMRMGPFLDRELAELVRECARDKYHYAYEREAERLERLSGSH